MATFNTNFNHGDTIYFMSDNVPMHGTVRRIEIASVRVIEIVDEEEVATLTTDVRYYCDDILNYVDEGMAFATLEDLLDSFIVATTTPSPTTTPGP
jgi:hypothetical protein